MSDESENLDERQKIYGEVNGEDMEDPDLEADCLDVEEHDQESAFMFSALISEYDVEA